MNSPDRSWPRAACSILAVPGAIDPFLIFATAQSGRAKELFLPALGGLCQFQEV